MGSKGPGAVSYHLLRLSRKARDRARLLRYRSLPKPVVPPPVPRDHICSGDPSTADLSDRDIRRS